MAAPSKFQGTLSGRGAGSRCWAFHSQKVARGPVITVAEFQGVGAGGAPLWDPLGESPPLVQSRDSKENKMTETQQKAWLAPSDSPRQLWCREQKTQPGLSPPSTACCLAGLDYGQLVT